MTRALMCDVLLQDLLNPSGLYPLLGIEQRELAVVERLVVERRMAGEKLQNITALLECVAAAYDDLDKGKTSRDDLIKDVWVIIQAISHETEYDEAGALLADANVK